MIRKEIMALAAGLLTIAAVVGLCYKVDVRWVKSETYAREEQIVLDRIAGIEKRMEQQILMDRVKKLQERIWDLERYYRGRPMPDPVRREILMHKREIEEIMMKLTPMPPGPGG